MIYCLIKTETMTIPEFLNKDNYDIEHIATNIRKNKVVERFTVTFIACCLYAKKALAAGEGVDILGNKFLLLIRQWAKWVLLIMCAIECIRAGINGESKDIGRIIIKYLLLYASLFLVPMLFDMIAASFS